MKINNFDTNIYVSKQSLPAESEPVKQPSDTLKNAGAKPASANSTETEVAIDSTINVPQGFHLVQPKETLYSIANHYGITVSELIEFNPDLATDKNGNKIIKSGSVIKVSKTIESGDTTDSYEANEQVFGSWTIEQGKGAYSVMSKFNLFREELALLNPQIDLNNLKKDEVLKVPGYKVKAGDTLYGIAKAHDITVDMLKELNPGHSEILKPDEILNVPKLAGQDLGFENLEVEFDVVAETPQKILHTIKNGEALSKIAEKYNVPMWAIMLHNNIENEDKIFKDQVLEISTEEEVVQLEELKNKSDSVPDKTPKTHTVKKGDTLSEIAIKYGISLKDLKEWNNLRNDRIDIGKVLKLSKPDNFDAPKPPQDIKYTVKSGDVLSKIALKYGVSTASIMYKNNIQNPKHIQPGQTIVIPDKAEVAELEAAQRAIKAKQATPSPQRKKVSGSTNVPSPTNTVSLNRGIVVHKVKKGDTLLDISKKYNIPVKDLLLYNYNLKGIKSSENLSEKEVKNVRIIATKNAVIDATGVSEEFINDLISIEKKRNRLYNDDCGIPTIGIGHNTRAHGDTSFYRGKTLSDNQIYSLLARDIFDAQSKIKSAIGKDAFDNLSRGQKEALYGLVFNTGNLSGSPKLVEALKKNDYVEAACQMDQACGKIKGKLQVLPGLAKRRFMDISKFIEGSRFSRSDLRTVMSTLQNLYDKGFNNIQKENTKVDYNAYAKKFLGDYIDKGWIDIRS